MAKAPVTYTPELAAEICKRLSEGESLRNICKDEHTPTEGAVRAWVVDDHEGFATQYARARDFFLDIMAEQTVAIADETETGVVETDKVGKLGPYTEVRRGDLTEHRRLRVDTRKWYLSKLAPKRYGERLQHAQTDVEGNAADRALDDSALAARIEAIFAAAAQRKAGTDFSDLA